MPKSFAVRLWEILPGLMSWLTLAVLLAITFISPILAASLILVYSIYWLVKIIIVASHLVAGFVRYRRERRIDWHAKLKNEHSKTYRDYYQVAMVASYKEDISILRHTLHAIQMSHYDLDRLIVVVAFEERDQELAPKYAPMLIHEFEHHFHKFLITFHPTNIEGEVKGKGPNITWSARRLREYLDKEKIAHDKVILTTLDADNRVDEQYFANLTYTYLNSPDPVHKSFQPLPMFFNNIHLVPMPVKIVALGSSFWQMTQAMRPYFLRNFSAHAQSFAALVETDYWSVTTVVEDGHQYWRSYFKFDGNHEVMPLFVPIYMDAVQGDDLGDTFREQYLQRRRWFWGVSDVPFVFKNSWGNRKIGFIDKWMQFLRLLDSHISLSTQSFILMIGWLPISLHPAFRQTVMGYNFPVVYRALLGLAWVGMITTMTIATMLVPPEAKNKRGRVLEVIKYWILTPILMPFTSIFFAAIPALDSQTRLLLNKPFTVFNVTKKAAIPGGVLRESEN